MNKINKTFLIFVIGLFIFGLVSAVSCQNPGLPNAQQINVATELIQICESCSFVNISSITSPNSTISINLEMTENGTTYNYTYVPNQIGSYFYSTLGDKDGANPPKEETLCFEVTQSGGTLDTPQSIIIVGLFFILLLLAISFLYWGNKIDYLPFKIFITSLGGLFLMFTIGVSANVVYQLLTVGAVLSGTFNGIYRLMLILTSTWGIGLILYIIYMSVRQFYSYRGLIDKEIN